MSTLLAGLTKGGSPPTIEVSDLAVDSREVIPGGAFIALAGTHTHGERFIADAIARGAVAILHDAGDPTPAAGVVPLIPVPRLRAVLGVMAERFFGEPAHALRIVGVTGTNGKTTVSHLLAQALNHEEARCAVLGTAGNGFPGALAPASHTTAEPVALHRSFAALRAAGASDIAMEVSSHALVQDRVAGVPFEGAVFTNLTRDHLDYHGTMEAYGQAKARLFEVPSLRYAVLNVDDPFGQRLHEMLHARGQPSLGFGETAGEVRIVAVMSRTDGLQVGLQIGSRAVDIRSTLFGRFNAWNLAAVAGVLAARGWDGPRIAASLSGARAVPGRMDTVYDDSPGAPVMVVDYAHSPDALAKALAALREHAPGRLFCVFGCGGDRDAGKRPLMGRVAEEGADQVIITNDNPRTEAPARIVSDILAGCRAPALITVIEDRAEAIRTAYLRAGPSDVVLVAGKGHETTQDIGDERLPFSDRACIEAIIQKGRPS